MILDKCNQITATLLISFHLLMVYGGNSVYGSNNDDNQIGSNFHIEIERKSALELNGVPVSKAGVLSLLNDHEKQFIFGKHSNLLDSNINIVKIVKNDSKYKAEETKKSRKKRSTEGQVTIQIQDDGEQVNLKLEPTPKIVDDAFTIIHRYGNSSHLKEGSHKLALDYEKCFYRNENSILDLCENQTIRGFIKDKNKEYFVHPLPSRIVDGNPYHILIETEGKIHSDLELNLKNFEPKNKDFDEFRKHRKRKQHRERNKRHIATNWIPEVLHVETAIFVDRDLFQHMARNFPENTEEHLIRFILALVNGVQLLYNHPSLGRKINYVLKKLVILHNDPSDLVRSSDIDTYLNNFCLWQRQFNPQSDADVDHYDHAVILTGLDLHVMTKSGKLSSQVVGLAPVAGMCTSTSSCTINEGKHFESVFVVAHEIGHNLGMRHDTKENSCDPSLFIMSPTLGSGKITWSKCSRGYLNAFLKTAQARCLFDSGQFGKNLDHSAEGMLPGERFTADQQCLLKYGKDSVRAKSQELSDICRDLHCFQDRFTWTSHPALEGTSCGKMMWCRSGVCVSKAPVAESYMPSKQVTTIQLLDKQKFGKLEQLKHEYESSWSDWGQPTDCASGCLYGESGRLGEGSTGLKIFTRNCINYKRRCEGKDRMFEQCSSSEQCTSVKKTTIKEFATRICERAMKYDPELTGKGLQILGESIDDACKVFCRTKQNRTKSRSWVFPDGTSCHSKLYNPDDISFCISGKCEKFSCENTTSNYFRIDPKICSKNYQKVVTKDTSNKWHYNQEYGRSFSSDSRYNNHNKFSDSYHPHMYKYSEASMHKYSDSMYKNSDSMYKNSDSTYKNSDSMYKNSDSMYKKSDTNNILRKSDNSFARPSPAAFKMESEKFKKIERSGWVVKSGCHFGCMHKGKGVQVVSSANNGTNNIQLCSPKYKPCDILQTAKEYADGVCLRYKQKVRGLSGNGMQISANIHDPDRSCRVSCQDEILRHRYYFVVGSYGFFPLGTKCSYHQERYCINGKCLEFGPDDVPLTETLVNIPALRSKREIGDRMRRSYIYFNPVNVTETVTQEYINELINNLQIVPRAIRDDYLLTEHIEFMNPINISMEEINTGNYQNNSLVLRKDSK